MKSCIVKRLMALVLVIFLFVSITVSVSALPMFTINLAGIIDADGQDRTSWQITAANYLSNINNSHIFRLTAFNKCNLLAYLRDPNMFVIHTHGDQRRLQAVDANGELSFLTVDMVNALPAGDLENLKLAYLGGCETGEGGTSATNIVNAVFAKGARCVIGYKETVVTPANYIMIREFCTAIGCGYTISEALAYADSRVLAEYGSSGDTHDRLVRGDTSVSFAQRAIILGIEEEESIQSIALDNKEVGYFNVSVLRNASAETNQYNSNSTHTFNSDALFDTTKYKLSTQYYTEDTGLWTAIYNYTIAGMPTNDSVIIMYTNNGDIVSFMHPNNGVFDDISLLPSDLETARNQLSAQMVAAEISDYSIKDARIVMQDNTLAIRYSVAYTVSEDIAGYEVVNDFYVSLGDG